MSGLDEKLADVARQYDELQGELARPDVVADPGAIRRLGKELARLEPVVGAFRRLEATREELAGARHLRDSEPDDELRSMAREEVDRLEADETEQVERLKVLLLPRDPNDDRNVIMEVRAGAGGEEAGLFAAELLRMYLRYAERRRWPAEVLSLNESGIGGVREAIVRISGDGAYSRLKFEGGVHRVQRVPVTESSGLVVEIQDEKSQHKNKAKALAVLRSRLYEQEQERQRAADSAARRIMVGAGDRSEKVRTYNYPQNRITDHRIGKDLFDLPAFLQGDLDEMIDSLNTSDQADRLRDLVEADVGAA
ncbi:MAG TPA: PCRF domain-containing protein [Candidatus Dormibacteraeota bacterium]|nr:PCRF domain-containing protein [Candidatus Dormibacteraeota bacterium]